MSLEILMEFPMQGREVSEVGVGKTIVAFYTSLVLDPSYSGNIHIEVKGFDSVDESDVITKDTYTAQTNFRIFDGTNYDVFPADGMPSIFESAYYIGSDILAKTYVKWRIKDKNNVAISDWVAGELVFGGKENLKTYDIYGIARGKPDANEEIYRFETVRSFLFSSDMVGSRASASIAPLEGNSGLSVFSIQKSGIEFSTFTFVSGITTATFENPAVDEAFAPGDILTVVAPTVQDSALSTISWTFKGEI